MLGYSLHPVILHWWLHTLSQIIGPVHSWFHLNSAESIQPCGLLVHRNSTDNTISALTVPFFFTSLVWRGSGNKLLQGPHYDRFSQNSNPWSCDHWFGTLTNSATVTTNIQWVADACKIEFGTVPNLSNYGHFFVHFVLSSCIPMWHLNGLSSYLLPWSGVWCTLNAICL